MNVKISILIYCKTHGLAEMFLFWVSRLSLVKSKNFTFLLIRDLVELKRFKKKAILFYIPTHKEDSLKRVKEMRLYSPNTSIILYSDLEDVEIIHSFYEHGIKAHVSFSDKMSQLITALEWTLNNKVFHSIETHELYTKSYEDSHITAPPATNDDLTSGEKIIIKYVCNGFTNQEISEKRFRSVHTIKKHRQNIYGKLGVNNISDLMVWCRKNNFDTTLPDD